MPTREYLSLAPSTCNFGNSFGQLTFVSAFVCVLIFGYACTPLVNAQQKTDANSLKPVRIGIIGLDNYQAVAFAQLFNDPKATAELSGLKVVAAVPLGSKDLEGSLADLEKWKVQIAKFGVEMVDSIEKLLPQVDAVMVMSLDGRKHLEQAGQALAARKPVYIGRPMAASLADVQEIFRLSKHHQTPCWSSSQHRFSPGFIGMREHPEVGKVLGCDVYGGCPTEPHHPEFVWHALHGIETLFTIMGPGCVSVTRISSDHAEILTGIWSDGRVGSFRGIKKGAIKYSATVFGEKGVSTAGIYGHGVPVKGVAPTNDKYMGYEGIAREIGTFFKGGKVPVTPAETVEIFAFMKAADLCKELKKTIVRLDEVTPAR